MGPSRDEEKINNMDIVTPSGRRLNIGRLNSDKTKKQSDDFLTCVYDYYIENDLSISQYIPIPVYIFGSKCGYDRTTIDYILEKLSPSGFIQEASMGDEPVIRITSIGYNYVERELGHIKEKTNIGITETPLKVHSKPKKGIVNVIFDKIKAKNESILAVSLVGIIVPILIGLIALHGPVASYVVVILYLFAVLFSLLTTAIIIAAVSYSGEWYERNITRWYSILVILVIFIVIIVAYISAVGIIVGELNGEKPTPPSTGNQVNATFTPTPVPSTLPTFSPVITYTTNTPPIENIINIDTDPYFETTVLRPHKYTVYILPHLNTVPVLSIGVKTVVVIETEYEPQQANVNYSIINDYDYNKFKSGQKILTRYTIIGILMLRWIQEINIISLLKIWKILHSSISVLVLILNNYLKYKKLHPLLSF